MRFASYLHGSRFSYGILQPDDLILDVPLAVESTSEPLPSDLDDFIAEWETNLPVARRLASEIPERAMLLASTVTLLAPVRRPSKIIAVGLNYRDHVEEQKAKIPSSPVLFAKFPSAIIGPGDPIRWDPALTSRVDFEAELAVVIGRRASRIAEGEALDVVAGYTILNDVSARDLQFADRQWVRSKSLDSFCPLGPVLVTVDDVPDPNALRIGCTVNDVVMQESNTSQMIFGVRRLIAFITRGITLEPGDIIATGTPAGVGAFRTPPSYLRDGDEVVVSIEGIGDLGNPVSVAIE
jgi:2-keto-4-pentenoate hydratase/2-oxohepta-3-ene-1,7-dioic acid hydratase in catechol pathway